MTLSISLARALLVAFVSLPIIQVSSAALAAGLTVPQPDQAMTSNWTGFYVGSDVAVSRFSGPVVSGGTSLSLLAGANLQQGQFMLGARGGISFVDDSLAGTLWAVRADVRAGVLITPSLLAYGTLGLGRALIANPNTFASLGVGAEFMVADHVSIYAEATHGTQISGPFGPFTVNGVSAGLNWHF